MPERLDPDLPEKMTCANPGCDRPAIHDRLGQTGLCQEHLKTSYMMHTKRYGYTNREPDYDPTLTVHCALPG